eukprot:XP_001691970.1 predicted protein [Chlamydomonas reinhardtii]
MAGMAGGILFAYAEGSSFDACAKQWRLFADIANDLGMTVELASPLLPRALFLPCACFGSIARSVTVFALILPRALQANAHVPVYLRGQDGGGVLSPLQVAAREDLTPPPFRRLWDWASAAPNELGSHQTKY